ncbi:helix-turn-helix domain-containing protein [Streptomyces qinglanensis]|uniref:Helix-turn-helix domain-containing protein n=1 Tax=Streptomyces qinglanensis TaxID=943816 RepID=A0A1H9WGE6_9ACTN|nr:helix-turn-helix domain-containing protein [Streptomyces qinglanensis]SES33006.1 Helix-turn-helix domain-containing protein [Streptomyces qinglanensis]
MTESPHQDRTAPHQGQRTVSDPATLKALAHPLRLRILRRLATAGPATATALAAVLDQNTGTLSYHLRQLERAGLVEDDPHHTTNGRERWWRGVRGTEVRRPPRSDLSAAERVAVEELDRAHLQEDIDLVRRHADRPAEEDEWAPGSRSTLHLTQEELREFHDAYLELLQRFRRHRTEAGPDTRPVAVRWFGIPLDDPRD